MDGQTAKSEYYRVQSAESSRVSPHASIVGDVRLGERASVLAFASLRGDLASITVEDEANIQEGAIVHVSAGHPAVIRKHATVGHGAIVHGCEIGENTVVGMGAAVMDGAIVGADSVIGAHALVTGGKVFPPRSLLVGSPARLVRELSESEVERMCTAAGDRYLRLTDRMLQEGVLRAPQKKWTRAVD